MAKKTFRYCFYLTVTTKTDSPDDKGKSNKINDFYYVLFGYCHALLSTDTCIFYLCTYRYRILILLRFGFHERAIHLEADFIFSSADYAKPIVRLYKINGRLFNLAHFTCTAVHVHQCALFWNIYILKNLSISAWHLHFINDPNATLIIAVSSVVLLTKLLWRLYFGLLSCHF